MTAAVPPLQCATGCVFPTYTKRQTPSHDGSSGLYLARQHTPAPVRVGQREPDCVQLQEDDEMGWVGGSTEEVLAAGRQPASHAMPCRQPAKFDSVIDFSLSSAPSASGAT